MSGSILGMSGVELIFVVVALVVGAGVGYFIGSLAVKAKLDAMTVTADQTRRDAEQMRGELSAAQKQCAEQSVQLAQISATFEEREKSLNDQIRTLKEARDELSGVFAELSKSALEQNNSMFLTLAKQRLETQQEEAKKELETRKAAIDEMVKPLSETLGKVDEKITVLNEAFGQQKEVTSQLVNTLRVPGDRGRYGEIHLERLFEMVGLTKGFHYTLQHSESNEEQAGRFDAIVMLPDDRCLVVDSKTPLNAYDKACNAPTDRERTDAYREHAKSVRGHISELAKRKYDELPSRPLYVVMYLPVEGMFSAAIQHDSELLQFADDKRIYIATPTMLMGFLRLCSLHWTERKLAESAAEIRDLGAEMHKRVATFAGHMTALGKNLKTGLDAYNNAMGSLERNVLSQARKFKELGATSAELPEFEEIAVVVREFSNPDLKSLPESAAVEGSTLFPADS